MLQIRSILDVADNTGAKRAAAIGVLGRNQRYAHIGDVIKAHIKEAAPDGTVKKGRSGGRGGGADAAGRFAGATVRTCGLTATRLSSSTRR